MERAEFVKKIQELDPDGNIVSINLANEEITYAKEIIQHRVISKITGLEELVRAYFVVRLVVELGYKKGDIELEKEYEAGRPKPIKPRIDILVKDHRTKTLKTFLFIEVKAPNKFEHDKEYIRTQLFELAKLEDKKSPIGYLCYVTADLEEGFIREKNIIIDYTTFSDYDQWVEGGKLALDELPKEYGEPRKAKYLKGKNDLYTRFTKDQFDLLRKDLHDVLWGGGGTNYNEIFIGLVKIFLAKIYDENNTAEGEAYQFQIEYKGKVAESAEEVFQKVNRLYVEACKSYLSLSEAEAKNESLNKRTIAPSKVRYVVEQLQGISLTRNGANESDTLGDFFEGIVTQGFKQDKGQFFTPINIVRFIIYALEIDDAAISQINRHKTLPVICDPACGSGTYLIEVMRIITDTVKRRRIKEISTANDVQMFIAYKMPDVKENTWAWDYLYGIELNPDLALSTKVNMVLHGDGSGNIYPKDALLPFNRFENKTKISLLSHSKVLINYSYSKEVNEQFDFVISNPPFSIKLDNETKKTLPNTFEYAEAGSSENLFIERWYQLLKEGGKLGVVLPESVFDTGDNQYIRLFIYKYFKVKAVVSLPSGKDGAFLPHTPIKTSLLFLEKKTRDEVEVYEKAWREASNLYQRLKTKMKKLPVEPDEARGILKEFLLNYFDHEDVTLSPQDILDKHVKDIDEINRNPNWWIFKTIAGRYDYKIFLAHTKLLGYHKTKNRQFKRPNALFSVDETGRVVYDIKNPTTILDYVRSRKPMNEANLLYIDFSDIARSKSLRLDHRFYRYTFFEEPEILASYRKKPFLLRDAIVDIRNGEDVGREDYSVDANGATLETDYKYLTVNNVRPDGFVLDEIVNIRSTIGETLSDKRLKKNDLIITRSGSVGMAKVFDIQNGDVIYIPSGYLIIVQIDEEKLVPEFVEYFLNSVIMKKYFEVFGAGKTQQNVSQADIRRIPIPSFTKDEQLQIVARYKEARAPILNDVTAKAQQIEKLRREMDEIIPSAVLTKHLDIQLEE